MLFLDVRAMFNSLKEKCYTSLFSLLLVLLVILNTPSILTV